MRDVKKTVLARTPSAFLRETPPGFDQRQGRLWIIKELGDEALVRIREYGMARRDVCHPLRGVGSDSVQHGGRALHHQPPHHARRRSSRLERVEERHEQTRLVEHRPRAVALLPFGSPLLGQGQPLPLGLVRLAQHANVRVSSSPLG